MYCAQWVCTSLRCCKIYLCFIWDTTISTNSHNRTCVVVVLLQFSKCVWGGSWRGYTIIETKLSFTDNKSVWCNCNCGIRRRGLPWDGHWCAVDKDDPKICRRCWNWESCIGENVASTNKLSHPQTFINKKPLSMEERKLVVYNDIQRTTHFCESVCAVAIKNLLNIGLCHYPHGSWSSQ